jgi:long-chain fatty acid transport protein
MRRALTFVGVLLGLAGVVAGSAGDAAASGFQLLEQNASGLGNAYAGTAASAEDASTAFFNPAGMSLLPGVSVATSLVAVRPSAKFSNNGSTSSLGPAILGTDNGGDASDWAYLPGLYYVHSVGPSWALGLGVNAPFGLKTEYDQNWIGRFQAIRSELLTLAITPVVSYRITESLSVGVGVRVQRADAELRTAADPRDPTGAVQSLVRGDDWGLGVSAGMLWQITAATRVGLAYQSQIKHTISGELTTPLGVTPIEASITLPDIVTLSVVHQLSPSWELLADVAWTNWSKFDRLEVVSRPTGTVISSSPQNWHDTWRGALGVNYRYGTRLKLRGGVAFDETPVRDEFRTARVPDESRIWLAAGVQYRVLGSGTVDIGYAHLFPPKHPSINRTEPIGSTGLTTTLRGEYETRVDIIGIQFSYTF